MIQLGGPPGLSPSTRAKGVGMYIYAQWSEEIILIDFVHSCDSSYILYGIVLCQNSLSSQRRLLSNSRIRIFAWIAFCWQGPASLARALLRRQPRSLPCPRLHLQPPRLPQPSASLRRCWCPRPLLLSPVDTPSLQGGRALLIVPQDDRGVGRVGRGAEHRLGHGGAGRRAARGRRVAEGGRGRQGRRVLRSWFAGRPQLLSLLPQVVFLRVPFPLVQVLLQEPEPLAVVLVVVLGRRGGGLLPEGAQLQGQHPQVLRRRRGREEGPHPVPRSPGDCEHRVEIRDPGAEIVDHSLQLVQEGFLRWRRRRRLLEGRGQAPGDSRVGQEEGGLLCGQVGRQRRGAHHRGRHASVHHHRRTAGRAEADRPGTLLLHAVKGLGAGIGKGQALAGALVTFSEGFDDGCLVAGRLVGLHVHREAVPHVLSFGHLSSTWFRP